MTPHEPDWKNSDPTNPSNRTLKNSVEAYTGGQGQQYPPADDPFVRVGQAGQIAMQIVPDAMRNLFFPTAAEG